MSVALVLVPGHAVCRSGCTGPGRVERDSSWIGAHAGEARRHVAQILAGVRQAAVADAWLVFSGGCTRRSAGLRSEAVSYAEIARDHDHWSLPEVAGRILVEEYARDSLENLILGICCLRRAVGRWPERVCVIGWDFKEERFRRHARAIDWPADRFRYEAVMSPSELAPAEAGEGRKLAATVADPLLVGEQWQRERRGRDPFGRGTGASGIDAATDRFLAYLAGGAVAPAPWVRD